MVEDMITLKISSTIGLCRLFQLIVSLPSVGHASFTEYSLKPADESLPLVISV